MKYSIFLLAIFLISCSKDNSCENCGKEYENAVIIDAGVAAADGCDWVIKTATGDDYHPDVLSDPFKRNGLQVKIRYEKTGSDFICGFNPTPLLVIRLIDIKQ